MKYTFKVPPSSTEQTVVITLPDLPPSVTPVITGTTPIDGVPPPVDPPPTEGYVLTFQSGYDTIKDLDPDGHNQMGRGTIVTDVYKTGPGSFKSVPENVSSGYRSEVQYDASRTEVEGATEVDVMFENYAAYGWGGSCIQWHPNNNNSANLFMYCSEGRFTVARNLGGSNMYQGGSTTGGTKRIVSKVWYRLRFEVKWSTGNDGYVIVFIDGALYFTYNGRTQDNDGVPYLKIGQNNWGNSKGTTMYFDNLKVYKKP